MDYSLDLDRRRSVYANTSIINAVGRMKITVFEIKSDYCTEAEIDSLLEVFLKKIACSRINGRTGLVKSHTADYVFNLAYTKRSHDNKWEGYFQNGDKKLKLVAVQEKD